MSGPVLIRDIDLHLSRVFPHEWAEDWDRVGLSAGDSSRAVAGVLLTLDPTRAAIARALALGANVLVSHHPAALTPPARVTPGRGPGGVLFAALDSRVALIAEHTNLDRAPQGARALPEALGLAPLDPIERALQPMTRVTVYAPRGAAPALVDAMAAAGAGRIGAYERAAFLSEGTGEFTPTAAAVPYVGAIGVPEVTDELRIEMVCPAGSTAAVTAAARGAHPYEEPLVVAEAVTIARGAARMGMQCASDIPLTLRALAERAAARLGTTPRVWGNDADVPLGKIVTATGSASSLVGDVISGSADALVCGEVRYHDALDAVEAGLSIIELGHDVSEWPLVEVLARAVRETPDLDSALVFVDTPSAAWWTPDGR